MITIDLRNADTLVPLGSESVPSVPERGSVILIGPDRVPYEVVHVYDGRGEENGPSARRHWIMCRPR